MRRSGLASLAFFYCDFRDDKKKDRRDLLSSFLVQLCDQSDSYYDILSSFYSAHGDSSQCPGDNELTQCLTDMVKCPGEAPIYIIVDALDECPDAYGTPSPRENVLNLVRDLTTLRLPKLRICVTSRPEADIKILLNSLVPRSVSLHDEGGQKQDIVDYIKSVITTDTKMQKWRAEDKELAIETLSLKADGMYDIDITRLRDARSYMSRRFRWVSCQFDFLRRCLPARIRRALGDLPETLDATYERTLRDIDEANWEFAHRLFQCITVASRPFYVKELAEFLAFDFEAGQIPKVVEGWRAEDPGHVVLSTCSSLIAIVGVHDSQVVQFSHFSVKEFLTSGRLAMGRHTISRYHILMTPAHTIVAQACLGALLHLDENVTRDSLKNFPLANYAADHWVDHAQFDNVSPSVQDGIKLLFDPIKPHFKVWVWISDPDSSLPMKYEESPSQPSQTPLHYATLYGMCDIVEFLVIERSQDTNAQRPSDKRTPLFMASVRGDAEVTRTLLRCGANANAHDHCGDTPLHLASEEGHLEAAGVLLSHGTDVNSRAYDNMTPLHYAVQRGYLEAAQLLLDCSADANAQDDDYRTSLHRCSQEGHPEIAQLLLDHGADANARDQNDQTPLHLVSHDGRPYVSHNFFDVGAGADTSTTIAYLYYWSRNENESI